MAERKKKMDKPVNIAIFASGAGSNAAKLIEYFHNYPQINISLVVCNVPQAGVLSIANQHQIDSLVIQKEQFFRGDAYLPVFENYAIDWIVLAGFLWKVPPAIIKAFPGHIVNIHPALLPRYGGKGMYGHFVHEAVIENKEKQSGISIHYVDEIYDHGKIIFQATCKVEPNETAITLAKKIQQLEHRFFAPEIHKLIMSNCS